MLAIPLESVIAENSFPSIKNLIFLFEIALLFESNNLAMTFTFWFTAAEMLSTFK